MQPYTPRRAAARWLEGAPAYILDVFDNKGKTWDRYTVVFGKEFMNTTKHGAHLPYLGLSEGLGFSQWGELPAYEMAAWRKSAGRDRIRWLDLPEHIRAHVIARATATE